jgi:hypothetical protein
MIHAAIHRTPDSQIGEIKLSITAESIPLFKSLVDRALNCWDSAPVELKELGDMLTHGRITQDHRYQPINTNQNTDYRNAEEYLRIDAFIKKEGLDAWLDHIRNGTTSEVTRG